VADMNATLGFYRRLGWAIDTPSPEHAVALLAGDVRVEFDSPGFAPTWDSSYSGGTGGTTVLGLAVEARQAVDDLCTDLAEHGHAVRQAPL